MTAPWLKTLDEIEGGHLPLVGGKAFNLATLRRHGLPVPQGLVVTTAFFEAQLERCRFVPLWAGSPDVAVTEDALLWLADTLKTNPLAQDLEASLRGRLAETFPNVESFAIRSSAVDEDSRHFAFSGIHLTELGVPRQMVPVSLSRCWASALSKPALEYRRQHGIPIQSIRLAVIIQPFIKPATAGVAFTVNPLSGARDEMVIEAIPGHGGRVVSGQVTPARYRLAKHAPDYALLDWTAGDAPQPTSRNAVSAADNHVPLSTPQLQTLAQYLEQIEALMAAPQDVEWAICEEDEEQQAKVLFLQTRPITVLPETTVVFDVVWSRANHREYLPDLPSPMCVSLLERTQNQALSFLKHLGFNVKDTGLYLKIIYGRPYLNLTLARRVLAQCGLNPSGLLWTIGHTELPDEWGSTYVIDWRQVWESWQPIAGMSLHSLRASSWLKRFKHLVDEIRGSLDVTDWAVASPGDLLSPFRLRTQLASQMIKVDFVLSAAAVAVISVAARILGSPTGDLARLIKEAVGTEIELSGTWQGRALIELAKIVRADEETRLYLVGPRDNFDDYRQALKDTSFLSAFDEFLEQNIERATFEADPGWPRFGEDPSPLLAAIAQMAKRERLPDRHGFRTDQYDPVSVSDGEKNGSQGEWASQRSVKDLKRLPFWRSWPLRLAIRRLHRVMNMRTRLRDLYGQSMSGCRNWDLKLAERWATKGWLVERQDYFWLRMEEIERTLMAEAEVGPTLSALVHARRETYETYAATEMPYTLRESDVGRLLPGHGLVGTALSSVLSGLPISPGQVQGRVVVLRQPKDSVHIQEGAILVTPSTDPAWFSIFPQARGLIVETGGLLSHGSIIAREFGLPAVANIPDATTRFRDGDLVLLDGGTGLVQILDPIRDESRSAG